MAVLNICSCSECDCEYTFTGNGLGLGKETFAKYRSQVTRDIAAGKYGEELRRNMVCPESVYLEWANEYTFCPRCNLMHFGGRLAVYLHKEGKPANLAYDDWTCTYHLSGFCAEEDYREILLLPTPCGRCQGEVQYFSSYEEMSCPKCGCPMTDGEILPRERVRHCPDPYTEAEPADADPDLNFDDFDLNDDDYEEEIFSLTPPQPESGPGFEKLSFWERIARTVDLADETLYPRTDVMISSDGQRGEVREYGSDGKLIEATHLRFESFPDDPDEDILLDDVERFYDDRYDRKYTDLD